MLPIHSHVNQKRVFSKNQVTFWQSLPPPVRFILVILFYAFIFVITFVLSLNWTVKKDWSVEDVTFWDSSVPHTFRFPNIKGLESLGKKGNGLVGNPRYVQHKFLEQVRDFRFRNPDVYSWDSYLKQIFPNGWQGTAMTEKQITFPIAKLHRPTVEQLNEYVRKSIPVILTGVVDSWPAYHNWTDEYLAEKIGDVEIPIEYSKTRDFYGDSARQKLSKLKVRDFLKVYRDPNRDKNYYLAETSILKNFQVLLQDFPKDLDFIPKNWNLDVIQLWIGPGGQITPSHNDESENILCQFRGSRTFYLHDPFQVDLMYTTRENSVYPSVKVREGAANVKKYPLYAKAHAPITVFLNEGECLYLPAVFYHRVESTPNLRSLAINYWYTPQSLAGDIVWMAISSHEWKKENEPYEFSRKRPQDD